MIVWAFSRLILEDWLREGGGSGGVDIFIGCRIIVAIVVITPSGKVKMEAVRIHIHGLRKRSGGGISVLQMAVSGSLSALGYTSTPANEALWKPALIHNSRAGSQYVLIANKREKG